MLGGALDAAVDAAELAVTPLGLVADEIPGQRGTLSEIGHRPWALPERPWLMGQTWLDLLFAHWPVEPARLERLIPAPLELDLHDRRAWIGVTPFVVRGLRGHGMPPIPWLSRFPELNVRTYVRYGGKAGIYFFSLDTPRTAAVIAARRAYRLPYFRARASTTAGAGTGGALRYESARADEGGPPAELSVSYRPSGPRLPVDDGTLPRWLAERYCLYVVDDRSRALRGEIHHPPWPLQPAEADVDLNTMVTPLGLDLEGEPLLHYSARQDTVLWRLAPA